MKLPWYLRQTPTVTLIAGLGGLLSIVNHTCAQPWAATTAPTRYWRALASSADGATLVAAGYAVGYCLQCYAPIYVSADAGATWTHTSAPGNKWSAVAASADGAKLVAAAAADPNLGGGGDGLIYISPDMGATWTPTSAPSNNWTSVACSVDGAKLVAASAPAWIYSSRSYVGEGWVYTSDDAGATWMRTSAPTNFWSAVAASADGRKMVATAGGQFNLGFIYISTNSGVTWTPTTAPSNNWTSVASSADGSRLVAVAALSCPLGDGLVYTSADSGVTWARTTAPSNNWGSVASSADGVNLWAGAEAGGCSGNAEGGIYRSSNSGVTWTATVAPAADWTALVTSADGQKTVAADSNFGLLCICPYSGAWRLANAPAQDWPQQWQSVASSADGAKLVAVRNYAAICTSADYGATWSETHSSSQDYWSSVASSSDGAKLVAASGNWIYASLDSGATWTRTSAPSNVWTSVASSADGVKLVAVARRNDGDGLIYASTNSGATWRPTTAPGVGWYSVACSADGSRLVAAAAQFNSGRIYTSSDSGDTWIPSSAPSNTWSCVASSADGTRLVAVAPFNAWNGSSWPGLGDGLIYTSTNSGATWAPTTAPVNNWVAVSCSADSTKLVAAVNNGFSGLSQSSIYTSSDAGATWIRSDTPSVFRWTDVASSADGNHIVAVGSEGIYILQSPAPGAPLPPSPRLSINRWGANLGLAWLVPSTRFVLQRSSDLGSANWADVPDAPALDYNNLHYRVTLTPSLTRAYYRLKQQ